MYNIKVELLYDILCQPINSNYYPNRSPSPRKDSSLTNDHTEPIATVVKPSVYRPPGSTGALAAMMKRDIGIVGKVKKNPINNTIIINEKSVVKSVITQRIIPGMAPPSQTVPTTNVGKKQMNGNVKNTNKTVEKSVSVTLKPINVTTKQSVITPIVVEKVSVEGNHSFHIHLLMN